MWIILLVCDADRSFRKLSHAFEGSAESRRSLYHDYLRWYKQGDVVLDYGCGDGVWLDLLRGEDIVGLGVDKDLDLVHQLTQRGIKAFNHLEDVDIPYSTVTLMHVIEHLHPLEAVRLVAELSTGIDSMLLVTPNIEHGSVQVDFWKDITHIRPYPAVVLEALMHECGFTNLEHGQSNAGYDVWVFGTR